MPKVVHKAQPVVHKAQRRAPPVRHGWPQWSASPDPAPLGGLGPGVCPYFTPGGALMAWAQNQSRRKSTRSSGNGRRTVAPSHDADTSTPRGREELRDAPRASVGHLHAAEERGMPGTRDVARALIPPSRVRPQGGGTQDTLDETCSRRSSTYWAVAVPGVRWRPALGYPIGRERTAPGRRRLRRQRPRQRRAEADGGRPSNETRPHRGRYFKPRRLRGKHIGVRIARKGIESSEGSGRRSWVIERTVSWLADWLTHPPPRT